MHTWLHIHKHTATFLRINKLWITHTHDYIHAYTATFWEAHELWRFDTSKSQTWEKATPTTAALYDCFISQQGIAVTQGLLVVHCDRNASLQGSLGWVCVGGARACVCIGMCAWSMDIAHAMYMFACMSARSVSFRWVFALMWDCKLACVHVCLQGPWALDGSSRWCETVNSCAIHIYYEYVLWSKSCRKTQGQRHSITCTHNHRARHWRYMGDQRVCIRTGWHQYPT
jgi:hypothetical protein